MKPAFYLSLALISILSFSSCKKKKEEEERPVPKGATNECAGDFTKADAENVNIFPADNPWNTDVSGGAPDTRSADIMAILSAGNPGLKADFGAGLWDGSPIGIPYVVVCDAQPKVPIVFRGDGDDDNYGDESDAGPYPIPLNAPIEGYGEGDAHVIAVDVENGLLYELYNSNTDYDHWEASSGAIFDLNSNTYRPAGWTSADAAGLPIFPGLVRYEEILKGSIDHAIRFTVNKTKVYDGYVAPARHMVNGNNSNSAAPTPMGMRLRLKSSVDISGYSATNQIILQAMKTYGIILADIGSDFYISGAPDSRWDNDDLQELGNIKASDFEVVPMGAITE